MTAAKNLKRCQRCKGGDMLAADLLNPGTHDYSRHVIGCPDYTNEQPLRN